jgi:2-polyprenyl-3-methyl-5-hydroxy-6-metoxy-1,4-benzoquinol methylase
MSCERCTSTLAPATGERVDVDSFYDQLAKDGAAAWRIEGWDESGAFASRVAAHQYRTVMGLLNRELAGDKKKVLDWGCGTGVFAYAIADEGHEVWGTDPQQPPMGEEIARRTDGRFHYTKTEDPTVLPYDDATFDVVLSNGCLEHVAETGGSDRASLKEIVRILRPGGAFVCAHLPNEKSYIEAAARRLRAPIRKYAGYRFYAHNVLYSRDKVAALTDECGLELSDFQSYGAFPRNPLSLLPRSITDAEGFVRSVDWLDDHLGPRIERYCQNFAWIGRKPASGDSTARD